MAKKSKDAKKESWESLKEEGNKLFAHRKYDQALKQYSRALQKAPTNDVLFTNRALCKIKMKKYDEACSDAREAIQLSPITVKGHYLLGQALLQINRYDDSLKSLQTAQKLATDQRRNFGEEIAQSIRLAKRKRWLDMEEKRKQQEIELEQYLINLVLSSNPADNSTENEKDQKPSDPDKESRIKDIKALFCEIDDKRKNREVPDYLCDKISFELLNDPVITPSGISYNKKDIEEHLQKVGHFDPVTHAKLTSDMLIPNLVMKEVVENFIEQNEWAVDY